MHLILTQSRTTLPPLNQHSNKLSCCLPSQTVRIDACVGECLSQGKQPFESALGSATLVALHLHFCNRKYPKNVHPRDCQTSRPGHDLHHRLQGTCISDLSGQLFTITCSQRLRVGSSFCALKTQTKFVRYHLNMIQFGTNGPRKGLYQAQKSGSTMILDGLASIGMKVGHDLPSHFSSTLI